MAHDKLPPLLKYVCFQQEYFLGLFNGIIIFLLGVRPVSAKVKEACGVQNPPEPLLLPLNPLANKFIASPYALVLFRREK